MGSWRGDHVEGGEEGRETLRGRRRMVALLFYGGQVASTLLALAWSCTGKWRDATMSKR